MRADKRVDLMDSLSAVSSVAMWAVEKVVEMDMRKVATRGFHSAEQWAVLTAI